MSKCICGRSLRTGLATLLSVFLSDHRVADRLRTEAANMTYQQFKADKARSCDKRMYIAWVWRACYPPARHCQGSFRPD